MSSSKPGAEFVRLLAQYRNLSAPELERMRELSSSLSMRDLSVIASDRSLSDRMSDFYDGEIESLSLSGRRFASMMLIAVAVTMVLIDFY